MTNTIAPAAAPITQTAKILYSAWGYGMTMIEYYQVIKETPKSVVVVPMTEVSTPDGFLAGSTVPGKAMMDQPQSRLFKRFNKDGTISHYAGKHWNGVQWLESRYPLWGWDGRSKRWNHAD